MTQAEKAINHHLDGTDLEVHPVGGADIAVTHPVLITEFVTHRLEANGFELLACTDGARTYRHTEAHRQATEQRGVRQ